MKVFAAALIAATAMGIKLHEESDAVAELKKIGEKVFKETDKNADGVICIDEAKAAADYMGEKFDEADFKAVAGKDGVVDGKEAQKAGKAAMDKEFGKGWGDKEAKAVTEAIKKELGEAAQVNDVEELKKLGEKVFKETDKNSDGVIDLDEAKAAAAYMGETLDEDDFKAIAGEDGVVDGKEAHKAGKAAMDKEFGKGWGDKEAKAVTEAIKKELGEAAQVSDKQELKELGESLFHLTDMNDDGVIDLDEAKAAAEFMDMEWCEDAAAEFKKMAGKDNVVDKKEAVKAFEAAMAEEFGEDWGDKEAKMVVDAVEAELEEQKPDFDDFEEFVSEWCGADDIDHDDLQNFYDNASIEEWEGAFLACTGADNLAEAVDIIIAAEFADAMEKNHEDKPAKEAAQISKDKKEKDGKKKEE